MQGDGSLRLESTQQRQHVYERFFPSGWTARLIELFPVWRRILIPDFDSIVDFDGTTPTAVMSSCTCEQRRMILLGSPTWTSWRHFNNAEFKARGFELKAELRLAIDEQIAVDQLRVKAQMPYRSLSGDGDDQHQRRRVSELYGTGNGFYVAPSVGIIFNDQLTAVTTTRSAIAVGYRI